MSNGEDTPRKTLASRLEEAATYVSLLTILLCPPLAWLGIGVDDKKLTWMIYAVLLPIFGVFWLIFQYRRAKYNLEIEGKVQRPAWLWRLLTNRIPHKSQQLHYAQVMVIAPPGREKEATQLKEAYNRGGTYILQFHCIPEPINGQLNEDKGHTLHGKDVRTLNTLAKEMDGCAAIALLDDGSLENYKRTMKVVLQWSIKHTVRPIISIKLEGRGTLNYSWCYLVDVAEVDQALPNRLLAQAANRGAEWYQQAKINRRLVFGLAIITFAVSTFSFYVGYVNWTRANLLWRLVKVEPQEQVGVTRSLATFRNNSSAAGQARFQPLLQESAGQLRETLMRTSGESNASSISVIMFAVTEQKNDQQGSALNFKEIAATRPLRYVPFPVDNRAPEIRGIVGCAVARRGFVLWTGNSWGNQYSTSNIQAWDLQDREIGLYRPEKGSLELENYICSYKHSPEDDPRKRLLCAPVGLADDSSGQPTGAICVSAPEELRFLAEPWVRHAILRFGNALSFESWEKAILENSGK